MATTTASTDSAIDALPPSSSTDKEVAVPASNTDKQVLAFSDDDAAKEVFSPPSGTTDDSRQPYNHTSAIDDSDTSKQAIPSFPPTSMDKEVALPVNDGDKQLTSTLRHDSDSLSGRSPTSTALSLANASQTFRVEKYNPYGLILPQDQKLALRQIDTATGADRGAAYVTGEMSWVDVLSVLPPMFELYRAVGGGGGDAGPGGEAVGVGGNVELVARSIPKGWEGISGVKVEVECSVQSRDGIRREKWEMERRGLGRKYKVKRDGEPEARFMWKGTSGSVKELVGSSGGRGAKKEEVHKGNLKLVLGRDGQGEVLAVWQQARDSNVLGDLIIFDNARGKLATELIAATCLTAVSAERASGMNWFGGIGK